jgi:hypothetical protein
MASLKVNKTNKEWLDEQKQIDTRDNDLTYRKVKALEVIAEELIKLNSRYTDAKKMNHLVDLVRELDIKYAELSSKVRGDNG